ncbi:hypothetical protein ACQKWADRAFT_289425 [Trichoderma austrokoningii]
MTGLTPAPRYSAEDFDTGSVHSATPSHVSELPSYRPRTEHSEALPSYAAAVAGASSQRDAPRTQNPSRGRQTIGLPPLPPLASPSALNTHNYRIPTWSANNAPAARQYRNVAERRAADEWVQAAAAAAELIVGMRGSAMNRQDSSRATPLRPLEDPYLVGEQAAAEARRKRIASEINESMLKEEDKQWDWMLGQMKAREERDRPSPRPRPRQEAAQNRRRTLFGRIGGRLPR